VTVTFNRRLVGSDYRLVVVNGGSDGSNRVSSASVSLNGRQVFDPNNFNQRIGEITRSVSLAAENKLTVRLVGSPGGFVTISVQEIIGPNSKVAPCQDNGFGCGEPILVLSQPDTTGFDRELFASDGSNISEVFDAQNYRQANFRLSQLSGADFSIDWSEFVDIISDVTNAADSIHGIPLLITKVQLTTAPPQTQTFFMAALAVNTVFHQDITILCSPAFQLSTDFVERIQLRVENTTVDVDPSGNTPLQFASPGEKIVHVTVWFASGFVGENLFRIVVKESTKL
jgi:hypothetical protein